MKHIQPSESLANGLLLAFAGGMMDAYTYLCRGQVFANAETGNLVLLGIQLAQCNWGRALYYLWPIMSFALGVLLTEWLRSHFTPLPGLPHWRQLSLIHIFHTGADEPFQLGKAFERDRLSLLF